MVYRNYVFETNRMSLKGKFYTEAYREGDGFIFGSGATKKESEKDAKKNIDEYLDKYGE